MSLFAPFSLDQGTGPALLLLHAFPLDHRLWAGTAGAFSGAWRVLVPDLPGFGRARLDAAPDVLTMDDFADAVARALDAARVRPRAVAGCSMGGYVALALAERRPDLVPSLVLVDTRARADEPAEAEGRSALLAALGAAGQGAGMLLAERMLPRLLAPSAAPGLVALVRDWIRSAPVDAVRAAVRGMAVRPDRTAVLAGFGGPVLVIGGEHDPITGPGEMRALAAAAPRGAAAIIEGAGHLPQIERPERFRDLLTEFPGRTLRASGDTRRDRC
jgi:pimeloyl-ACP methyl ester carboxylesterase